MVEEKIPDAYIIGVIVCRSMTSMNESIMKSARRGRLRYTPERRKFMVAATWSADWAGCSQVKNGIFPRARTAPPHTMAERRGPVTPVALGRVVRPACRCRSSLGSPIRLGISFGSLTQGGAHSLALGWLRAARWA
jgi:hypothetical protein